VVALSLGGGFGMYLQVSVYRTTCLPYQIESLLRTHTSIVNEWNGRIGINNEERRKDLGDQPTNVDGASTRKEEWER